MFHNSSSALDCSQYHTIIQLPKLFDTFIKFQFLCAFYSFSTACAEKVKSTQGITETLRTHTR